MQRPPPPPPASNLGPYPPPPPASNLGPYPTPPQDAIDRGWLLQDASAPGRTPNLLAVLVTAHEVAAGLQHLHTHDVVHGDLSAYNVMLSSTSAAARLADRGFVAKIASAARARRGV